MIKNTLNKKKTSFIIFIKPTIILILIFFTIFVFYEIYQSNLIKKKTINFVEKYSQDYNYTLKVTNNKLPILDILNFHSTPLKQIHAKIISWTQKDLGIENYLSLLRFGLWIEAHSPPLYEPVNM